MNGIINTVLTMTLLVCICRIPAEPWKLDVNSNLLLTLNSFSDNWAGGDAGSFTWAAQALAIAEKPLSAKVYNKNTLKLAFGQTKTQDKTSKKWSMPAKSTDLIDFESLFKVTLGGFVDPYGSVNLLSRFSDQDDPGLMRYVNPLDIKEAAGAMRDLIKKDQLVWSLRLGAAARQIIDRNKLDPATQARSTNVVNDGGAELVTEFKANNNGKSVQFVSTFKLYEAFISSESEVLKGLPGENDWRYPHINWENVLTLNVAKYLMFNLYGQILYDKPVDSKVRLKETISIGITYSFSSAAVPKP